MGATDGHLRGSLLSPFAAFLSVVMPGAGHLAIGARFRAAVVVATVANVAAMIAMAVVLGGVHGNTDFGDVIANRAMFLLVAVLLVVMAATRGYSEAGGLQAVRTLHLAPPLVTPGHWDPASVRELVAAAITVQPVGALGALPILADACG